MKRQLYYRMLPTLQAACKGVWVKGKVPLTPVMLYELIDDLDAQDIVDGHIDSKCLSGYALIWANDIAAGTKNVRGYP